MSCLATWSDSTSKPFSEEFRAGEGLTADPKRWSQQERMFPKLRSKATSAMEWCTLWNRGGDEQVIQRPEGDIQIPQKFTIPEADSDGGDRRCRDGEHAHSNEVW